MFITPIVKIDSIEQAASKAAQPAVGSVLTDNPFRSMFNDAINSVRETEGALNDEIYKVATGQTDDLHNAMIASTKANLSIELLVQIRNQALDAYKEIMNTSV